MDATTIAAPPDPAADVIALDTHPAHAAHATRPDFAAVYQTYLPKLARFIARNTTRDAVQSPEDLAHDALLNAWRKWGRLAYRGPVSLNDWLYTIALNVVRDDHRHRRLVGFRPLDASPAAWRLASDDPLDDPEARALHDERRAETRAALARSLSALTPRERRAFLLIDVRGLTARAAARELSTTPTAVRNSLFLARVKLSRRLGVRRRSYRMTAERRQRILSLRGVAGARKVAGMVGVSEATVSAIWKAGVQ